MKILVGGDLVPTESNFNQFISGDVNFLFGEKLCEILDNAEIRIFNLEVPLSDFANPISKSGPNLIAPSAVIKGIKKINPSCLGIANNHILDHGEQGFHSTVKILEDNKITFVGGGENIAEASKPIILEKDGIKIGIYACAETEFSIAAKTSCGANPFDVFESFDHVSDLKTKVDFVIVLYHGGREHYRYPSPGLQKRCRKFVRNGADLVVCQHSHCIGCKEEFLNGTIVYGQGNFIFDDCDNEYWATSLLLNVDVKRDCFLVDYIPLKKCAERVCLANTSESQKLLEDFFRRSDEIKQEDFIIKKYSEFSLEKVLNYLSGFCGKMRKFLPYRVLNKILRRYLIKNNWSLKDLLFIQNSIRCEAHRELLLEGLQNLIDNKKEEIKCL